jgi:hypothetical protein
MKHAQTPERKKKAMKRKSKKPKKPTPAQTIRRLEADVDPQEQFRRHGAARVPRA